MEWAKVETRLLFDPQFMSLPMSSRVTWYEAILHAHSTGQGCPQPAALAWACHRDKAEVESDYRLLSQCVGDSGNPWMVEVDGKWGMPGLTIQPSKTAAERVKAHRDRKRGVTGETLQALHVTGETLPKRDVTDVTQIRLEEKEKREERSVNAPAPVRVPACEERTESDMTDRPFCQFPVSAQSEPVSAQLGPRAYWVPRAWFNGSGLNRDDPIGAAVDIGMKVHKWGMDNLVGELNSLPVSKGRELISVLLVRSRKWASHELATSAVHREVDRWLQTSGGKKAAMDAMKQTAEGGME
jgi:hypothetical protein